VVGPRVAASEERVVQLGAGGSQRIALRVVVRPPATGGSGVTASGTTEGAGGPPTTPAVPSASSSTTPTPATRAPAPALATQATPTSDEVDPTRRTLAWVAFGVGAAGLVGTVVSAAVRTSALDKIEGDSLCNRDNTPWTCPTSEEAKLGSSVGTGDTASTLVNVFLPLTLVGAATGVVLLATSHRRGQETEASLFVSPAGVSAMGQF
jgi:hypothetical protein